MYRYIILIFSILNINKGFRILFSPSSLVKKSFYNDFIDRLENKINKPISFLDPINKCNEEKIIITHSIGGNKKALYNYISRNDSNVIGIIFIQSYFNYKNKIDIPTLTILNTNDEKIPLYYSIDDFLLNYQKNIPNKYYLINPGTHFSSFENILQIEILSNQIETFIKEIQKNNFYRMNLINRYLLKKHSWFFENRNLTNTIEQSNFIKFLISKPFYNNIFFNDNKNVFFKTNNITIDDELNTYYNLNLAYNLTFLELNRSIDIMNSMDTLIKITKGFVTGGNVLNLFLFTEYIIKELINELLLNFQKPNLIHSWLTYEPQIYIKNNKIECEILCMPIKENITYYKFPSKHKLFDFILKHDF